MTDLRNRRTETLLYVLVWLLVAGLYLLDIMRSRYQMSLPTLDWGVLWHLVKMLLPFFLLFLINNCVLIPFYLLKNRFWQYFLLAGGAVLLLWGYQWINFAGSMAHMPPRGMMPPPHIRPLIPLPLVLDITCDILVVGCNLAVALMFRRFDDKLEKESLMKTNAENQLAYLKAQINPHFYMNMLNNIHGMIEIDPEKAQGMVIDMSNLMRYMIYDSSKPLIGLDNEVAFLRNYLRLMRQRYPENLVTITATFPDDSVMKQVSIPPLLFLVFIENAFKHGISYREPSFVNVAIEVSDRFVNFSCSNSNHGSKPDKSTGIGLQNIGKRLALIYGDNASLQLHTTDNAFIVNLSIPIHETTDADNR